MGQGVFLEMFRSFISTYKNKSATFENFLEKLPTNLDQNTLKRIRDLIRNIDEDYLKRTCPAIIEYNITGDEKTKKIKNFEIFNKQLENIEYNTGVIITDIMFFFLKNEPEIDENASIQKKSSFKSNEQKAYKFEKFDKIEITCSEDLEERFKDKVEKPDFVLLNYTDNSYFIQVFSEDQITWIENNIKVNI